MWWGPTSMKKIMTENRLFFLGGPETQLHDILWAVHDGKNRGRSDGEDNFWELPVTGGWSGAERIIFCHAYDTYMTIIVTKPGIIIDVVGSYFYDKKS